MVPASSSREAPEPAAGDENPLLAADRVPDITWPPAPFVPEGTRWAAAAVRRRAESPDEDDAPRPGNLTPEELERIAGWQKDAQLLLAERRRGQGRREIALPHALAVSDLVELATDADRFAARVARPLPSPPAPAARRGSSFHALARAAVSVEGAHRSGRAPRLERSRAGSDRRRPRVAESRFPVDELGGGRAGRRRGGVRVGAGRRSRSRPHRCDLPAR